MGPSVGAPLRGAVFMDGEAGKVLELAWPVEVLKGKLRSETLKGGDWSLASIHSGSVALIPRS